MSASPLDYVHAYRHMQRILKRRLADIFRLIPRNERAAFGEMLAHELSCVVAICPMTRCAASPNAHGTHFLTTAGQAGSANPQKQLT